MKCARAMRFLLARSLRHLPDMTFSENAAYAVPDILCVFGTRPEAIKLAPVVGALRNRGVSVGALCTGQHVSLLFGMPLAEADTLGIPSDDSVWRYSRTVRDTLEARWKIGRPRIVVVQGDTISAYAACEAAKRLDIPVAHVEAGVRSRRLNDPWPEESLRLWIDRDATYRYAATEAAQTNLAAEDRDCVVTGNTGIDALYDVLKREPPPSFIRQVGLITLHRRELRQRPDVTAVLRAVWHSSEPATWLVHPAMEALVRASGDGSPSSVEFRSAASHEECVARLIRARWVLTDSGGLTEEAATLGVPTAILRYVNDRPEAEAAGVARRFDPTPKGVSEAFAWLAGQPERVLTNAPFGDGHAAERIADDLSQRLTALLAPSGR